MPPKPLDARGSQQRISGCGGLSQLGSIGSKSSRVPKDRGCMDYLAYLHRPHSKLNNYLARIEQVMTSAAHSLCEI